MEIRSFCCIRLVTSAGKHFHGNPRPIHHRDHYGRPPRLQVSQRALKLQLSTGNDGEMRGDLLDFRQQVTGEKYGHRTPPRQIPEQFPHFVNAAGSRPLVGSSRISRSGSASRAVAIPSRCFIPVE
jgi:Protein of unknown function (DUF1602).